MKPTKLGLVYINDLLHDALTSRIAGTNRPFTHLIRTRNGNWVLFRENSEGHYPEVNYRKRDFDFPQGCFSNIIRFGELSGNVGNDIPLVIKLEDYRPCKLTTIKILDREIPKVIGGGNVYNFIEEIIDQTYQWYIDIDQDRPSDDFTNAYGISAHMDGQYESCDPVDDDPDLVEATSATDVDSEDEDPFGPLYERPRSAREDQWNAAFARLDPPEATKVDKKQSTFTKMLEAAPADPVLREGPSLHILREYLFENGIESDFEVNTMINLIRCFTKDYNYIMRTSEGQWIINQVGTSNAIGFYQNSNSVACKPLRTKAFVIPDDIIRFGAKL